MCVRFAHAGVYVLPLGQAASNASDAAAAALVCPPNSSMMNRANCHGRNTLRPAIAGPRHRGDAFNAHETIQGGGLQNKKGGLNEKEMGTRAELPHDCMWITWGHHLR